MVNSTAIQILCLLTAANYPTRAALTDPGTCEQIRVKQCIGFGYNTTKMPNLVGQDNQNEAEHILRTFAPLVQSGCSSQLEFFLCSVYVPMCTDKVNVHIGPCRPLCQNVRSKCEPILKQFGYPWPEAFNCSKFPRINNDEHMCMDGPEEVVLGDENYDDGPQQSGEKIEEPEKTASSPCSHIKKVKSFLYRNSTGQCVQLCHTDFMFSAQGKQFAEIWLTIWTALCFTSTLFTIITFLISSERLLYPERCILYISVCYNFYSIGYFIRIFSGRKEISCQLDKILEEWVLVQDGSGDYACGAVFILLYYSGSAANVWWLLLICMWILCQGHGWTHEKLKEKSKYFHAIAWAFPAACVIAVLLFRVMDADEITGSCFIGNQNKESLLWFVIVPLFISAICGIGMNILGTRGYVSRRSPKQITRNSKNRSNSVQWSNSETFPLRIGVYCILYTIPVICLLGSYWYEYKNREEWVSMGTQPNETVFIIRICMSMLVGSTSFLWMCSKQTLHSLCKLCCLTCCPSNNSNKCKSLQNPINRSVSSTSNANFENNQLDNGITV